MKSLKTFQFILVLSLILLCGCYFTSNEFLRNDKKLIIEQHLFLNGTLSISLPKEESISLDTTHYTNTLYSKWLGFSAGDYPISRIVLICKKYIFEPYNLCTNKPKKGMMPQESTLYVTSNVVSDNFIKKFRFADLILNGNRFHL